MSEGPERSQPENPSGAYADWFDWIGFISATIGTNIGCSTGRGRSWEIVAHVPNKVNVVAVVVVSIHVIQYHPFMVLVCPYREGDRDHSRLVRLW